VHNGPDAHQQRAPNEHTEALSILKNTANPLNQKYNQSNISLLADVLLFVLHRTAL